MEFTLDVFDAPLNWGWGEWKEKESEFRQKFEETVKEAVTILGQPRFVGGYKDSGYPMEEGAVRVADWPLNNADMRIAIRHEDREVPIRLCITLRQQRRKSS
jgi:hypothetical protein